MPAKQFNEVTPVSNVVSASPFHVISYQEVKISTDLSEKQIYPQGSVKEYSDETGKDEWVKTFSLTDLGLQLLMNAAGIRGMPERIDDRQHPHICCYRFHGEWVQPDSTVISYPADYELDLRGYINVNGESIRGARFEQQYRAELERRIDNRFEAELKALKLSFGTDKRRAKAEQLFAGLSEGDQNDLREIAEGL